MLIDPNWLVELENEIVIILSRVEFLPYFFHILVYLIIHIYYGRLYIMWS